MEQIVFLTYLNRSGSTFLAKLLNEYSDIGVSLEARLPDGIFYGPLKLKKAQDIEKVLNRLYADEKFLAWNIDRNVLRKKLSNLKFPIKFNQFLNTLLQKYFKKSDAKIFIYKCAHYIRYIETIKKLFPKAKFIFVLRDIRAIYNSQKNTLDSITKRPMVNNPIVVAVKFKRIAKILRKNVNCDWLYVIKYENLMGDKDYELNKILDFLGSNRMKKINNKGYSKRIPNLQKSLHKNIDLPPLVERINAWQDKLSKSEILAIQKIAGDALSKSGYKLVDFGRISFKDRLDYIRLWLHYYLERIFNRIAYVFKRIKIKG